MLTLIQFYWGIQICKKGIESHYSTSNYYGTGSSAYHTRHYSPPRIRVHHSPPRHIAPHHSAPHHAPHHSAPHHSAHRSGGGHHGGGGRGHGRH